MKVKIGQEIKFKEEFEIESFAGATKTVKVGDKATVLKHGYVKYMNGDAKGMLQKVEDLEVNGVDHENIVNLIFNRLENVYGIKEMLYNEDIEEKDFKGEIEDLLYDYL